MWLALNQLCGQHSHNPARIITKFIYQVSKNGGNCPPAYATELQHETKPFDGRLDTLTCCAVTSLPATMSIDERVISTEPCVHVVVTPEPVRRSSYTRCTRTKTTLLHWDEPDFLSKKDRHDGSPAFVFFTRQRRVKDKAILASVTQSCRSPRIYCAN